MDKPETQSPVPFVQELLDKLASNSSTTPEPKKNISSGEDAFIDEEVYGDV